MPRFNTESNEYRVTFIELNVQSVPDILKTLQQSHSLHGKKLSLLCFLSCLSRFFFLAKRFWHTPQVKVLWCLFRHPWISTTPISITPLLRRKGRRCLDLTPNPTSTELRSMNRYSLSFRLYNNRIRYMEGSCRCCVFSRVYRDLSF
jgi:hypothetical protein